MELANKGSGARPLLSERHFVQHPVGSQHKDDHLLGVGLGLIERLLEHLGQSLAVLELMRVSASRSELNCAKDSMSLY